MDDNKESKKMFRIAAQASFAAATLALAGCGGGGGSGAPSGGNDDVLGAREAEPIIESYLADPQTSRAIHVGGPVVQELVCTAFGLAPGSSRSVCVVYGASSLQSGAPAISADADYILVVPQGSAQSIHDSMSGLNALQFSPILQSYVNFGDIAFGSPIAGSSLVVRDDDPDSVSAECEIRRVDDELAGSVALEVKGSGVFAVPPNAAVGLAPGPYAGRCSFTNVAGKTTTVDAFAFQVLAYANTAPQIASFGIRDEDGLLKQNGMLRDVIGEIVVAADDVVDIEDDLRGYALETVGVLLIDDAQQPDIAVEGNAYSVDLSQLGGRKLTLGLRVVDSDDAASTVYITRNIHANAPPAYRGGLQEVVCMVGGSVVLPAAEFEDAESDSFEVEYSVGDQGSFACETVGTFTYTATATDRWGAVGESPPYTITVSVTGSAPEIERGGFVDKVCVFGLSYFCATFVTMPTCTDADGDLPAQPVVYRGGDQAGSYASGEQVLTNFGAGYNTVTAYCVDGADNSSEEVSASVFACYEGSAGCF